MTQEYAQAHAQDRDDHTGYLTTGHEWNGIKELNTPVPRLVYFFLALAVLYSIGYWILMPAWPIGVTYTKGLLGLDQRDIVKASLQQAALDRGNWTKRIETASYTEIQADPQLMTIVRQTGKTLFGDNCAVCHGLKAKGGPGFPNLTTGSWLWGGDPAAIAETIRVGINSSERNTRVGQMPAFGANQILPAADIEKVALYVRGLSDPSVVKNAKPGAIDAGKAIFTANCAGCHGDDAKGKMDIGAPNLTDKFWIYGGDAESVWTSIWGGRQGHMPTWEQRLSAVDRKILALYLVDLRDVNQ
jgi:cytochrome c oxidase cbb3-type subunit 3